MRFKITITRELLSGVLETDTIRTGDCSFTEAIAKVILHAARGTDVAMTIKPMADRRVYQRDLMRKRRGSKVGSIEDKLVDADVNRACQADFSPCSYPDCACRTIAKPVSPPI